MSSSDKSARDKREGRFYQGLDGFRSGFPGLARLVETSNVAGIALNLKERGEYDWIAVAKRSRSSEGPQVAFGFGVGPIEALCHLDGQVAAGKWREDTPWSGK